MKSASVNYFNEIRNACDILLERARGLNSLFSDFSSRRLDEACSDYDAGQKKLYSLVRSVEGVLYTDFITPIEREDIVTLLSSAVSVLDSMGDVLREIRVWGISTGDGVTIEFSDLLLRCMAKITHVASELERFRKKPNIINNIRDTAELARKRDTLYTDAMTSLIKRTPSPTELAARSRIYSLLDEMLARTSALADAFGMAVIKNI